MNVGPRCRLSACRATIAALGIATGLYSLSASAQDSADPQCTRVDPSPRDELPNEPTHVSRRRVFAHYFPLFSLSIDDLDPDRDYYAVNYLRPEGEGSKFAPQGGFLRDRPLPRPSRGNPEFKRADAAEEVRRAVSMGIDGFAFNLMDDGARALEQLGIFLDAAVMAGGGRFGIVLMPDMSTPWAQDATRLRRVLERFDEHPGLYRHRGRIVVAPYLAETRPALRDPQGTPIDAAWWQRILASTDTHGSLARPIFVPVFHDWERFRSAYAQVADGMSDWGIRTARGYPAFASSLARMRAAWPDGILMAPVAPQDARPKDFVYQEALGSELLRRGFEAAESASSDWIHLVSWNDYSESTQIAPSDGTGWAYAELARYLITRFKSGREPVVANECLVYLYRPHSTKALPDPTRQRRRWAMLHADDPPADIVEVVALLAAPALIEIRTARSVRSLEGRAGLNVLTAPLEQGSPTFRLVRNGTVLVDAPGRFPVDDRITFQSLVYRGGVLKVATDDARSASGRAEGGARTDRR